MCTAMAVELVQPYSAGVGLIEESRDFKRLRNYCPRNRSWLVLFKAPDGLHHAPFTHRYTDPYVKNVR